MTKIYCRDCGKFKPYTKVYSAEYCNVIQDDYYSPKHATMRFPSTLNVKNDCSFFRAKSFD